MGFCTRRHLFLSICLLQIVTVLQRQVFDFLGFLWIPILVNFFEIIFVIFGFFGAYQYRPKYIIAYLIWHAFWAAWNVFLICLYLNVAGLDHESNKVLKLDPTSDSWWKREGPGCKGVNVDEFYAKYEGCFVDYVYVEIFQAGLQCFLAVCSSIIGICLSKTFMEEDDTFNFEKADGPDNFLLHPMYVSSRDNLHISNKHLNSKHNAINVDRCQKFKRNVRADAIRVHLRKSNSFDTFSETNKRDTARPKSMCSNSYNQDY